MLNYWNVRRKGIKRPKFSKEWRENMSKGHRETELSLETKRKIGFANKGKKRTEKFKKNISVRMKKFHTTHSQFRENNPSWKGGKTINSLGYVYILMPIHPHAVNGYVLEHRLIMEKHLGHYLKKGTKVHHKNGNPSDNRINNLEIFMNQSEHAKYHYKHSPSYGIRVVNERN